MNLPLEGIKVIDATSNIAGPYGGAILADLGADVIKIETPAGDPSRSMAPLEGDRSAYFHIVNRNKEVQTIDLKVILEKRIYLNYLKAQMYFLQTFYLSL